MLNKLMAMLGFKLSSFAESAPTNPILNRLEDTDNDSESPIVDERELGNLEPAGRQNATIARRRIIADLGDLIQLNPVPGIIRDVKCLPHNKETTLLAICMEIANEADEEKVRALEVGALMLADYQEGVGDKPIFIIDPNLIGHMSVSTDREVLREHAAKVASSGDPEKHKAFNALAEKDISRIREMLLAAQQMRRLSM